MIYYFHYSAKTLAGELIPDLKANLNEHPSIYHSLQIWIRLKKLYFHEKWENHFTHKSVQDLLSAKILSGWKVEFILPYLVRKFQISARNKLTGKCLLTFPIIIIQGPILTMAVKSMLKKSRLSNLFFSLQI